ncbi:hypothetical protein PanWU01x14_180370, partial [Parasponia andersonii]
DDILKIVTDIYNNWNTKLNEHFRLVVGNKNTLDLATTCSKVPNEMNATIWEHYCDLFNSLEFM